MNYYFTGWRGIPVTMLAIILLGSAILAPENSYSQISFTTLTTANGLPTNDIRGVSASGPNIYLATGAGVAISSDGGSSFVTKTTADGLGSNTTYEIFVDGSTVYVATLNGLSVSTDGGNSFTNITLPGFFFGNLVSGVFVEGSNIYASTSGGLSISNDGGGTFNLKTTADGLGNNNCREAVASGSIIYVANDGGLSISTDGGNSFINKTQADGLANTGAIGVTLGGSTVYAVSEGFTPFGGLSISNDMGNTFTVIQSPPLAENSVNNVFVTGPNIYVGTSGSSFSVSNDGAGTFDVYGFFDGIPGVTLDTYVDGNIVYLATNNGLAIGVDSNCVGCVPVIPTVGEWGLILLALLILSFGTVAVRQQQLAVAGNHRISVSVNNLPFHPGTYTLWLTILGAGVIAVFAISTAFFNYEMTNADLPGSLLGIPLAAYLLHLLFYRVE